MSIDCLLPENSERLRYIDPSIHDASEKLRTEEIMPLNVLCLWQLISKLPATRRAKAS